MHFNIIITFNDALFLLACVPLVMIFWVMFKDWTNDRNR